MRSIAHEGTAVLQNEEIARFADFDTDPGDAALPEAVVRASEKIAEIYAGLLAEGMDDELVARAMLGATVSLYDGLGLAPILPRLLRVVAEKVEAELAQSETGSH